MYQELIKIPKDRIAVLIGAKGKDKRLIEKQAKIRLQIDSKEGNVTIEGEDNFQVYLTKLIVKAVGRGFNPKSSLELLQENHIIEFINVQDYAGKSKNKLARLKSRIIGTEGKARKTIQAITSTNIVIYGKTVGIMGETENVMIARRAIENLLKGSKHGSVYYRTERDKDKSIRR